MYNLTTCYNCNSPIIRTKETRESRAISSINELIVTRDEDSWRLEGLDRARDTHKAMVCERLEPTVVKILSNSIRSVVPARYLPGDNIEIRRTCQRPNQVSSPSRLEIHPTRREWARSFLSRSVLMLTLD